MQEYSFSVPYFLTYQSEVNEIIEPHHPDTASLRHELIGEKLLEREHGVYQRAKLLLEQAGEDGMSPGIPLM
jgi:hypothetical protein